MQFDVLLLGLNPDWKEDVAIRKLATTFNTTEESIAKILKPNGHTVKRGLALEAANKYKAAIEANGGVCKLSEVVMAHAPLSLDTNSELPNDIEVQKQNLSQSGEDIKNIDLSSEGSIKKETTSSLSVFHYIMFVCVLAAVGVGFAMLKDKYLSSGPKSTINSYNSDLSWVQVGVVYYYSDSCKENCLTPDKAQVLCANASGLSGFGVGSVARQLGKASGAIFRGGNLEQMDISWKLGNCKVRSVVSGSYDGTSERVVFTGNAYMFIKDKDNGKIYIDSAISSYD